MRKNDETEELIKIFVTSIKTAEKKPRLGVVECSVLGVCFFIRCWNNLRSGATSLFDVRRSMFDPPEADKCLLACGELDVHLLICSTFIFQNNP